MLIKLNNGLLEAEINPFGAALAQLSLLSGAQPRPLLRCQRSTEQGATTYYGCVIGRLANRSRNAECYGQELEANEGPNHLHGGSGGLHNRRWTVLAQSPTALVLSYTSPDGEMGYAGTLELKARYELEGASLTLRLSARSDRDTALNLTHHPYWNLDPAATDILEHQLQVVPSLYTPVDAEQIPDGRILSVHGTALDFSEKHRLADVLRPLAPELAATRGLDHNYFDPALTVAPGTLRPLASLEAPTGDLKLTVASDAPGLQVYSCNWAADDLDFAGRPLTVHCSCCLEPQSPPDAQHHPQFPSIRLAAGADYQRTIRYELSGSAIRQQG